MLYNQALKLLDRQKIIQIGRERNGEPYVKRFNTWIDLVVMLYAVFMRFNSLCIQKNVFVAQSFLAIIIHNNGAHFHESPVDKMKS